MGDRAPLAADGISVVVPVYNNAPGLPALLERLQRTLESLAVPFEVILVNDGSADDSWDVILRARRERPWLRGIHLMRNYGQHNALLCGIRQARFPITVTLDDDLQNPPEEIPKLLDKLAQGYDLVYGTPSNPRHGHPFLIASYLLKLGLAVAVGAKSARIVSPLRAFRTQLRQAFADVRVPRPIIDIMFTWVTSRIGSVPVRHEERREGKTVYTFARRVVQALDLVTGFSTVPLKIASLIGFAFTLFGILVLVYVIVQYLLFGGIPGWPFLASTIAIFSGAQLFALGVVGEYLSRVFERIMELPSYAIRETTDDAAESRQTVTDKSYTAP